MLGPAGATYPNAKETPGSLQRKHGAQASLFTLSTDIAFIVRGCSGITQRKIQPDSWPYHAQPRCDVVDIPGK